MEQALRTHELLQVQTSKFTRLEFLRKVWGGPQSSPATEGRSGSSLRGRGPAPWALSHACQADPRAAAKPRSQTLSGRVGIQPPPGAASGLARASTKPASGATRATQKSGRFQGSRACLTAPPNSSRPAPVLQTQRGRGTGVFAPIRLQPGGPGQPWRRDQPSGGPDSYRHLGNRLSPSRSHRQRRLGGRLRGRPGQLQRYPPQRADATGRHADPSGRWRSTHFRRRGFYISFYFIIWLKQHRGS